MPSVYRQQEANPSLRHRVPPDQGRIVSARRLITMHILTHGLYWFYLAYRNRSHYKSHAPDPKAQPIEHGMVQFIPIAGAYALWRSLSGWSRLCQEAATPPRASRSLTAIAAGAAVTLWEAYLLLALLNPDSLWVLLAGYWPGTAGLAAAAWWIQRDLNEYWLRQGEAAGRPCPAGIGETALAMLGALIWANAFLTLIGW